LPRRPYVGARDALASALGALSKQEVVLRLAAWPQAERLIGMVSEKLPDFLRNELRARSDIPAAPRGWVLRVKQAVNACEAWLNGLAEAGSHSPAHARPQELFARARRWIEFFPNLAGACIRLSLVLVALLWLLLGRKA